MGETILQAVWELVRLSPIPGGDPVAVFVKSDGVKSRLLSILPPELRYQIEGAPAVAVLGIRDGPDAGRIGVLTAAHLIFAARSLGLDCAPLWNVDPESLRTFFAEPNVTASFLCALGYGDERSSAALPASYQSCAPCRIL